MEAVHGVEEHVVLLSSITSENFASAVKSTNSVSPIGQSVTSAQLTLPDTLVVFNLCYISSMTEARQDHRGFLTTLSATQRISLTQKSNHHAVIRLLVLLPAMIMLSLLITGRIPYWPLLLLPLGILLVFLFTLMHEATHDTAFASVRLNRWVSTICGWILFLPPVWFRYFHLAHHRHTQDANKDPELQTPKPTTWPQYLFHLTGFKVWMGSCRVITGNALGRTSESYIPSSALPAVHSEARWMLVGYLLCLAVSIAQSSILLLTIWIIPIMLGQPFLRLYLLAEHGGCEMTPNMLDNTRTTFTTSAVRFLCWNMPYHTEHHVYPTVPFHRLPILHTLLREHLRQTENGYYRFNQRYIGTLQ